MSNHETGMKDKNYDLISVLYHCLQGAETSLTYIKDAEEANDKELVQYFKETQEQYRKIAEKAKNILAQRLS
jgi:hypothetical protein